MPIVQTSISWKSVILMVQLNVSETNHVADFQETPLRTNNDLKWNRSCNIITSHIEQGIITVTIMRYERDLWRGKWRIHEARQRFEHGKCKRHQSRSYIMNAARSSSINTCIYIFPHNLCKMQDFKLGFDS